jgi:hypothetical protein
MHSALFTADEDGREPQNVGHPDQQVSPKVLTFGISMAVCTVCARQTPQSALISVLAARLCNVCAAHVCWDCGSVGRTDIMARMNPDRVLCGRCCATYPGREWMCSSAL